MAVNSCMSVNLLRCRESQIYFSNIIVANTGLIHAQDVHRQLLATSYFLKYLRSVLAFSVA